MDNHIDLKQKLILEKRNENGSMDPSDPQPPFSECTYEQIVLYYFSQFPKASRSTWAAIEDWYRQFRWRWRQAD